MKKNIVKISITAVFSVLYIHASKAQNIPFELEKKWELSGFENPESVLYDKKNQVLYVSNVNGNPTEVDYNGYISKVSLDGKIIEKKWISDLNAPKGMALYKGKLYVSDITDVVEIDLVSGEKSRFAAPEAKFLNDVTVDKKGTIYVSNTFGFSAIYTLPSLGENRQVSLFIKSDSLAMPNGLAVDGDDLLIAAWGKGFNPATYATEVPGSLLRLCIKDQSIDPVSTPIGNLDGLEKTVHGYLLTDWLAGKLWYWSNYTQAVELLDLPQGSADIAFDKDHKNIYIPLMNNNQVVVYSIKQK